MPDFALDRPRDPEWYRRAVFYEVLIRGFQDASGDGTGDIRGLTSRLDYLQWLGIDCIWLLPIYESPLRDGGYDIADFMRVLADYGNIADFVELVEQAHKRGIRIIADLVMNHTSDAHPWFQASRSDPDGPFGDFYVWCDNPDRYADARIIFVDTETSNWTFDPVRGQYFWHRFFSHQPDLNFENPKVQDAMIEVLRFWLDLGIDGFRLDAVPYLYEREGTNCENLKETHEYLKRIRAEVDRLYPDRVLLAEANQWPADVVQYFGDPETGGNECHMAFHFPLMPRIFMAVRREQRYPISEILAQTPKIPGRLPVGHLPAQPRRAHAGDGHRRRAGLHVRGVRQGPADEGQHRHQAAAGPAARQRPQPARAVHRAAAVACPARPSCTTATRSAWATTSGSATGTACARPCSGRRTATAASRASDPQRLYLPPVMDPIYGYQALNVEAQQRHPQSLLHWTRRMIEIRKRHPVFGLGAYEELDSAATRACSRSSASTTRRAPWPRSGCSASTAPPGSTTRRDRILCVNNLSRFPQPVELDLRRFMGVTPVECMGGVTFPPIGELPYLLTLPGTRLLLVSAPACEGGT